MQIYTIFSGRKYSFNFCVRKFFAGATCMDTKFAQIFNFGKYFSRLCTLACKFWRKKCIFPIWVTLKRFYKILETDNRKNSKMIIIMIKILQKIIFKNFHAHTPKARIFRYLTKHIFSQGDQHKNFCWHVHKRTRSKFFEEVFYGCTRTRTFSIFFNFSKMTVFPLTRRQKWCVQALKMAKFKFVSDLKNFLVKYNPC